MTEASRPNQLVSETTTMEAGFEGPLPPAQMYAQYESAYPGTAERILKMAEQQQQHRMGWENKVRDNGDKAEQRGQWMAFALAMASIGGAVICGVYGQTSPAIALAIISVSGIAGRLLGRRSQGS